MKQDKKFVFVITYGRSGSTLLLGILNSIPGYRILGENMNLFLDVKKLYLKTCNNLSAYVEMEKNFNLSGSRNSWYNPQSLSDIKRTYKEFIGGICDPDDKYDTVGFKEIRYSSMKDLDSYLIWLNLITDCRFIFLTRNLEDTCKSMWHAKNPKCKEQLGAFEKRMTYFIRGNSYIPFFHLDYRDMVDADLSELFGFLGVEYDEDAVDRIKKVLTKKHSY